MHILSVPFSPSGVSTLIACLLGGLAGPALGQTTHSHEAHYANHATGNVHFPVSCTPQAQAKFNEAATLLGRHAQALAAWRAGQGRCTDRQ